MDFKYHSPYISRVEAQTLHDAIEAVPDFPKPGILFRNVMPALARPKLYKALIETMCSPYAGYKALVPDVIVGIESRGFIFAAAMAKHMSVGFVPVRKPGKLPGKTDRVSYKLEYGAAELEVQVGAFKPGQRVIIVDDLLATGGTAAAAAQLVRRQDASVISFDFVVELKDLGGHTRLAVAPSADTGGLHALLTY